MKNKAKRVIMVTHNAVNFSSNLYFTAKITLNTAGGLANSNNKIVLIIVFSDSK